MANITLYELSNYNNSKLIPRTFNLDAKVFEAAAELDIEPGMVEELYQGEHANDEDFAYQMADELGLAPEDYSWPISYIDWAAAARDLMMDYGESARHYFRTSY